MLESLREKLWQLHLELPKQNLVAWTSGNVSERDQATGYVVIKPSGLRYEDLRPEHMVVVDLEGKVIEGSLKSLFGYGQPFIYLPQPPGR